MYATGGSLFMIGSVRPGWQAGPVVASDFAGEAWTPIASILDLGRLGGEWEMIDQTKPSSSYPDGPAYQQFRRGNRQATRMQITMGLAANDAGQIAIETAFNNQDPFSFRIELSDAADGGTPSARMFVGFVETLDDVLEAANTVTGLATSILLQSNVVRIQSSGA